MPNLLNIILFLLISLVGTTQDFYPKDYFRSPVDIPIMLAGNFGEIRAGHFHAGLDIKTEGVDRKSTRLNSSHSQQSRMPSSA